MKKLFLSILVLSIFVAGCKKDEEKVTPQTSGEGEVVFAGHQIDQTHLKDGHIDDIAEYALIGIRDADDVLTEYKRLVHYIDGIPYTQTIKLPDGMYSVETFVLMDDAQTPDFDGDDVEIWACPMIGSEFEAYVDKPTAFDLEVLPFGKLQIDVEVLRFIPDEYLSFGFDWFVIEQSVLREHCFFGNLCIKSLGDYAGSLYENQLNGVQLDMTTIAYVEVWQDIPNDDPDLGWVLTGTFSNEDWFGEGAPICAMYEDYLMYDDTYRFDLYVNVADGPGFSYKLFHSWMVDESDLQTYPWPLVGEDNVTDYVIGTCSPDADLILPPYMDLPETATYYGIRSPGTVTDTYIDATLSNIPPGYDIWNGSWGSWCFDHEYTIEIGVEYDMDVYSSLYPWLLPEFVSEDQWDNANWLMNHLGWYDGYTWADIQAALWLLEGWDGLSAYGHVPAVADLTFAQQMYDDAIMYGEDYLPPPGGWAAVIFVPEGTEPGQQYPDIQTVFVVVDP